jgi:hypothetical protein
MGIFSGLKRKLKASKNCERKTVRKKSSKIEIKLAIDLQIISLIAVLNFGFYLQICVYTHTHTNILMHKCC